MTAQELHDACHEAMCECPQFQGFEDDQHFGDYGEFGKIPRKGIYETVLFWRDHGDLLWHRGYEAALPQNVQDLFVNIDRVIEKAIKDHIKSL